MEPSLLAPTFALIAAVLFGSSTNAVKQGLKYLDTQTGTVVSIGTTVVCMALASPWWMHQNDWLSAGVWVFAAGGLVHPIFSRLLAYEANKRVGPTVSATFDGTTPLFAAGMAIVALGEQLTLPIAFGTLVTMGGVLFLYWSPVSSGSVMQAAVSFALGAAFLRALIGVIGKFGLETLPNPIMGGFIAYCVSAVAASFVLYVRSRGKQVTFPKQGVYWFALVGILTAVAVSCFFYALLYGEVIVVTPIVSTTPLFAMLTAMLFGVERLTWRVLVSVLIVVLGIAMVCLGRT